MIACKYIHVYMSVCWFIFQQAFFLVESQEDRTNTLDIVVPASMVGTKLVLYIDHTNLLFTHTHSLIHLTKLYTLTHSLATRTGCCVRWWTILNTSLMSGSLDWGTLIPPLAGTWSAHWHFVPSVPVSTTHTLSLSLSLSCLVYVCTMCTYIVQLYNG